MEFLKRAQDYCESRGDIMYFCNIYTGFREYNGVEDSVWKTLVYLYGVDTANSLQNQWLSRG